MIILIQIPTQLQNEKFIIVNQNKQPIEKKWTSDSNYTYDEIIKKDLNVYGVLCGNNNLMVIDCDSKDAQEKLMQIEQIRNTFIVQTAGKKLYHFYFHVINTTNPKGFRIDNKRERVIDFQGIGTQVIGPNSMIQTNVYNIVNPAEIAEIDYDFICDILKNLYEDIVIDDGVKKENPLGFEFDEVCSAIKSKIKTYDLVKDNNNLTMCPLGHTSDSKKCFSQNGTVWKCFHCGKHGNIFHLYMFMNNCSFLIAKENLIKLAGLKDDFKIKILSLYADPKTKHIASEYLAKQIIKLNKIYTLRTDNDAEMWIYKNGIYVPHGRTHIKEYCRGILASLYKTGFVNQVIEKIIADTYINSNDFFINEDLNLIAVLNGILNLQTRELISFSPQYKFFNKLPIHYDPLIKVDKIIQFFKDILIDEQDLLVIQELFGYLLHRDYSIEKAFMCLGGGRNGKGKLVSLMETFIGKKNCCNIPLQDLGNDKFAKSRLHNKLANLSADLNKTGLKDTGIFKSLTGRDLITADRKFLEHIEFRNYAKMIFATNELPYTYDDTDGFWDRWIIIDFIYKFVDIPKNGNEKKIDTNILMKITTDKEMIGLLNWALDGYDRLFRNNKFSVSTTTENIKREWKRKSSSFAAFLMDNIEKDCSIGAFLSNNQINNSYSIYCEKYSLVPESGRIRSFQLLKIGGYDKTKTIEGITSRGYGGLKFTDVSNSDLEYINIENL